MPETIRCVHCDVPLRLPEQFIGQEVRCPSCQKSFTARLPEAAPPPPAQPDEEEDLPLVRGPRDDDYAPRRRPREEEEDEDYPRRRRPRYGAHYAYGDRSGLVLTLGILSLVFSFLGCACGVLELASIGLGLAAAIMGRSDLAQMKNGDRDPSGQGMTNAGMICGIVGCLLGLLVLLVSCLWIGFNIANHQ
jgi:hypothetical protein